MDFTNKSASEVYNEIMDSFYNNHNLEKFKMFCQNISFHILHRVYAKILELKKDKKWQDSEDKQHIENALYILESEIDDYWE